MDDNEIKMLEFLESIGPMFFFDTQSSEYIFTPDGRRTFRTHEVEWILEELRDLNIQQCLGGECESLSEFQPA